MLLTCPNCRSGLEVPDGTAALVRCPACKTVFSPEDGTAPEPEVEPKPKKRKSRDEEEDEDDKPRKKRGANEKEAKDEHPDFDPIDEEEEKRRRKKRRKPEDEGLSPEEKEIRRNAFERATWGCRLIWLSFGLFMLSMVFIVVFFFQLTFKVVTPTYITIAGVIGLLNWLTAAAGIGLCLSGPRAPGHWGYGISAAVATAVHLIFLLALVGQGKEHSIGRETDLTLGESGNARWGLMPTRLDATMYYFTVLVYPDEQGAVPKGPMTLSMITGVAEMIRTVLIMMLLSCMARAALDEDLAHKCTRAAGIASGGPGLIAILIFLFIAIMIETNAGLNLFTQILFLTIQMGVYSILIGVMLPSFMTAREVTDACEEPFQSLIPQL